LQRLRADRAAWDGEEVLHVLPDLPLELSAMAHTGT
jgi:hypothetical protein